MVVVVVVVVVREQARQSRLRFSGSVLRVRGVRMRMML
jgi:hypothetical protein